MTQTIAALDPATGARALQLYRDHGQAICRRTDRMFALLLMAQWLAGIVAACVISPRTWSGAMSAVHPHLWAAVIVGGAIASLPVYLALTQPGRASTRFVIAGGQMLASALLIHLTGGRIETHFHIFGSLAFLSFYRDWRVFVPATLLVSLDHLVRGTVWPESVYGVLSASPLRSVEHGGWVVFESLFLVAACLRARREMWQFAENQARLEQTNASIEDKIARATCELRSRAAQQAAIARMGQQALACDGFESLFPIVAQSAADTLAVPIALIVRTSGEESEVMAASGVSVAEAKRLVATDGPGQALVGACLASSRAVTLEEIDGLPQALASGAGVAIASAGDEYGVVCLFAPARHPFSRDDAQFLESLANLLSLTLSRERLERALNHSRKLEAVGTLAAGIAHEINTPTQFIADNLTFLRTAVGDLERALAAYQGLLHAHGLRREADVIAAASDLDYLREEIPAALNQSQEGTERVSSIVRAMKEFSHPATSEKTPTDINHALLNTLAVAANEWRYVAETETDFDPELPLVPALPGDLNQVFLNLVVNAAQAIKGGREAGGEKGRITIATRRQDGHARITIQDTGCGIPRAIQARIFDPFFTTKEVGSGSGQGLSIAHQVIVEEHGGTITVASEAGHGATFTILLPVPAAQVPSAV